MPTATISASGRRYRGLSAEERRADQRERLVRAAINEFSARGYHRTSVEDIVRSAHTSRTAFYAFFDNREAAMYAALEARCAACSTRCARISRNAGPDESLIEVGVTAFVELPRVRSGRGADLVARGHRHVARGQRAARAACGARSPTAGARDLGRLRPASRVVARRRRRSPSACSACCSSRCCTWSRAAVSTKRPRTSRRSSTRSSGCSRPPTEPSHPVATSLKLGIVTPVLTLLPRAHATWEETGTFADVVGDRAGGRSARLPPLHVLASTSRSRSRSPRPAAARYWDPLATFGALSAHTSTIRFAAHVLVLGYHHPLAIAKRYGTLDEVTGGRVILGVGVGSLREEFELLGAPFDDRGDRADDAMRALRASLSRARARVSRRYYDFAGFVVDPHAQQARVPLWVGGRTARSLRRAVELGDGWAPFGLRTPELGEMLGRARDTDAWAARDDTARRAAAERAPARPARRARARRRAARRASPRSARPASNVRFVHHSRGALPRATRRPRRTLVAESE